MSTPRALSIALGQPLPVPGSIEQSVANHVELVRQAHADLIVFPEMSLTGYFMDAPVLDMEGEQLQPLVSACAETGTTALVCAPIHQGNKDYIGVVAISDDGPMVVGAKTCLVEHEKSRFAAGSGPYTIELHGVTVAVTVCLDNWTDNFIRDLVALDCDVVCSSAFDFAGEEDDFHRHFSDIARKVDCPLAIARLVGPSELEDQASGCSAFYIPSTDSFTKGKEQHVEVLAASAEAGDVISHTFNLSQR